MNDGGISLTNLLYAEINVIGIILLFLFLSNMNKNIHKNMTMDQFIFNLCLISNILIFIFDTGMWLLNKLPGTGFLVFNYLTTVLYYISNPLICFLWLIYTDFKINESREGILKRIRIYVIPFLLSAILSIASIFTGWLFVIDENNAYKRGPYFLVLAFASLIYMIYAIIISIRDIKKNGWQENKNVNIYLVFFPILLIFVSLIQIRYFGLSIIWVTAMLAFASMYINIQNGEISTDHLTGLYNRRRLDEYLQRRLKTRGKDHLLFSIMLDLDDFKTINDKFGHAQGDKALVTMSEILRKVCKNGDDFIGRMGGDEFIIVGERLEEEDVKQIIEEIYIRANWYNKRTMSDWYIKPSMGYSILGKEDTLDSFLATADQEMYRNKKKHKEEMADREIINN